MVWSCDCGVLGSYRVVGDVRSGVLRVRWPRADAGCGDAGRCRGVVVVPPSHPYERGSTWRLVSLSIATSDSCKPHPNFSPRTRVVGWAVMACRGRVVVGSEEAVEVVDTRATGGRHDPGRSWLLAYRGSGGVPLLRGVDGVKRETTR